MNKRIYNVFFNTHTVSGIVISAALYVIFFAGSFALFKDEIKIWEEGKPLSYTERKDIDFDQVLKSLDGTFDLSGRDLQINFGGESDQVYVFMSASKDSLASDKAKISHYVSVDINTYETKTYEEHYSLGEFLYRLHFFAQLPVVGIYLAGFVSFFFLFAVITGVIVHWEKIISNFFTFNPLAILKRVWTDAHTALGIIGLPFQVLFAISGAYFSLSLLVLLPAGLLYNGDQTKLIEDMRPTLKNYEWVTKSDMPVPSFNVLEQQLEEKWQDFHLNRSMIKNYGGVNMKYILMGEMLEKERFIGVGSITYDAYSGKEEDLKNPNELSYIEDSQFVFGRLHFGEFGGVALKLIYFILALITCFVIMSGVLIWVEARNKKSMTISQRLYTAKIGHIYLAICLSMLPVTALAFLFAKFAEGHFENKLSAIYWFYFITWLGFIFFFRFKRDNYFINKCSLLIGAVCGFLIPIANGIISGNWVWSTLSAHQHDILLIDLLWIGIATTALIFYLKIKPEVKDKSAFTNFPIDYKNITQLRAAEAEKLKQKKGETSSEIPLNHIDNNYIAMRTKIIFLWFFLAISWIVHHIYGLFNIYYNETLIIEGATGTAPLDHHIFRILLEGICLLFALLTIEVSKNWFKMIALFWAGISALYNVYHLITAFLHEPGNISEIFMLILTVVANIFLVLNLNKWRKTEPD